MANLITAYILWLFLGFFGVHHFYLNRDRHAFVLWSTFGGCFGLGWLRDFWHLPEYVKECNESMDGYVSDTISESAAARQRSKPTLGYARYVGMLIMAYIFMVLVSSAFPPEWYDKKNTSVCFRFFLSIVCPLACAAGVHLVANIGEIQASFRTCALGSYLGLMWMYNSSFTNFGASCLLSMVSTRYLGLTWKPTPRPHKSKLKRVSKLFACGTVYLLLLGSGLYFNATITTEDGDTVPLRVAVSNFFKSPAWTQTKDTLNLMWQDIKVNGLGNFFNKLLRAVDPQGVGNAYKVLGLSESATQAEIKKRYKDLAKEWHPDKQKDPMKKDEASKKFMEIQEAYETLSKLKARRSQKNSHIVRDEF